MSLKNFTFSLSKKKKEEPKEEEEVSGNHLPSCEGIDTIEKDGKFEGVRIRVYLWDNQEKVLFFKSYDLNAKKVCDDIAKREGLSPDSYPLFSLWIIGCDLELQLKPTQDLMEIVEKFPRYVQKYTHCSGPYPWRFYFKREALLSKNDERKIKDPAAIRILYSEAVANVLTSRYPCPTEEDAFALAGIQLQVIYGDINPNVHKQDFLTSQKFQGFLPSYIADNVNPITMKIKYSEWEDKIFTEYRKHRGKPEMISQLLYLQYLRQWSFYGSTFFLGCSEIPPRGYFEHRTDTLYIGVNGEGLHIIDETPRVLYTWSYDDIHWDASKDALVIHYGPDSALEQLTLITPMSSLVASLISRAIKTLDKNDEKLNNLRQVQSDDTE